VLAALDDIFDTDLDTRFAFGLERLITGLRADLPGAPLSDSSKNAKW
jgi:hypothetical protein